MVIRSANITPDETTGIGSWTEQRFVERFKAYDGAELPKVRPGEFNTPMPWSRYAGMTREDLSAIYAYLQTVPRVRQGITKYTPPARTE